MFSRLTILGLSILLIFVVSCSDDDPITGPVSTDTVAPSAVTNLAAGSQTGSTITLTWTAPGDDGWIAKAQLYDIRYSTAMITEDNWDAATPLTGEPDPTVGGEDESHVVTGLDPTTTYYFAIRTADEVPNWSELSNVASTTTHLAGEWTVYTTANSDLPTNIINDIAFETVVDRYFATNVGLVYYDGTTWTTYDNSDSTLISDNLTTVVVDDDGDKWIGFRFDGAALLSGETIVHYDTSNGLTMPLIRDIATDADGKVWFATAGGGLFLLESDIWTNFKADPDTGLSNNILSSLGFDADGNLWIGYNFGGASLFDGVDFVHFDASDGFTTNAVVTSIVAEGANMWFGTDQGVFLKVGSNWTAYNSANSGLVSDVITSVAIDPSGDKWFGTLAGLCRFDGTNWTTYLTDNSALPDNTVQVVESDLVGNIWIGTTGGLGVFHD